LTYFLLNINDTIKKLMFWTALFHYCILSIQFLLVKALDADLWPSKTQNPYFFINITQLHFDMFLRHQTVLL
jgi:hypothetical protein